jgi:hypothetical protein
VRSWLGPDTTAVLEQGLGRLPARKLEELFRSPGLLPALQELVLTEGGAHWNARVRANTSTRALAARHRTALVRRLGLDGQGEQGDAATSEDSLPVESSRILPLVSRPGRGAMRTGLLLLVPLAAAAAVLVVIVPGSRGPEQPGEPGAGIPERVVIVRADLPADEPAPADPQSSAPGGWPAHPWESLAAAVPGPKPPAADPPGTKDAAVPRDWLVGSRDWTKRLEETPNLSAAQVRAAVTRARGAVTAVGSLATSGNTGFAKDAQSMLEAKCRKAVAELDRLQADMQTPPADEQGLRRAKQAIVRTLGEIELVLGKTTVADGEAAGAATEAPADLPQP